MFKMSEELNQLSSEENIRNKYQKTLCDVFYIFIKSEYPDSSKQSVSTLLHFALTFCTKPYFLL